MLQNFLEKDLDHTDYLQVIKKGEKDFISNLCIAIFMFIAKKNYLFYLILRCSMTNLRQLLMGQPH